MLSASGQAGVPESYFHRPCLSRWLDYFQLDQADFVSETDALRAVFHAAQQKGSTQNGIFGLRMQRPSFAYFAEKMALLYPAPETDRDRFEAAFGKTLFVHLSRRDKLEQAISLTRAQQSGLWHRNADGTELERLAPSKAPRYDAAEIARNLDEMIACDQAWEDWFATEDIHPLRLTYEDLSADPGAQSARVLRHMGVDCGIMQGITPPVAKLADQVNADWKKRFERDSLKSQSIDPV